MYKNPNRKVFTYNAFIKIHKNLFITFVFYIFLASHIRIFISLIYRFILGLTNFPPTSSVPHFFTSITYFIFIFLITLPMSCLRIFFDILI